MSTVSRLFLSRWALLALLAGSAGLAEGVAAQDFGATTHNLRTSGPSKVAPMTTITGRCPLPKEWIQRTADRFRTHLVSWTEGGDGATQLIFTWQRALMEETGYAVTDETLVRFPQSTRGQILVPVLGCYEKAEDQVLEALIKTSPETLPGLFEFYLDIYTWQIQASPARRWMAARSRDRLRWLAKLHKESMSKGRDEKAKRAQMLLRLAAVMRSAPYTAEMGEALDLLGEIVILDSTSIAARYMSATLTERSGDYKTSARQFVRLSKSLPNDPEISLRTAIARSRLGDDLRAFQILERLARSDAPDWIRILAYEERVRIGGDKRDRESRPLLEEALRSFPAERQLSLQLAALLIRAGDWLGAERVLEGTEVEVPLTGKGSPRSTYELPRRDELEAEQAPLEAAIKVSRARLQEILKAHQATPE